MPGKSLPDDDAERPPDAPAAAPQSERYVDWNLLWKEKRPTQGQCVGRVILLIILAILIVYLTLVGLMKYMMTHH